MVAFDAFGRKLQDGQLLPGDIAQGFADLDRRDLDGPGGEPTPSKRFVYSKSALSPFFSTSWRMAETFFSNAGSKDFPAVDDPLEFLFEPLVRRPNNLHVTSLVPRSSSL